MTTVTQAMVYIHIIIVNVLHIQVLHKQKQWLLLQLANNQWRGFYFNNGSSSTSKIVSYPISFNSIYFIIINNLCATVQSDTDGFGSTNGLNNNSKAVKNINNEIWVSIYQSQNYSDIFAIGI